MKKELEIAVEKKQSISLKLIDGGLITGIAEFTEDPEKKSTYH